MRKGGSVLQQAARWVSFVACVLTLVVGLIHVFSKSARIHWPNHNFIDDVNWYSWRSVFTFAPGSFVEDWTAVAFGIVGLVAHLQGIGKTIGSLTDSFLAQAIFQLIMALFGTIAFAGGIGMIFSAVPFLATLLCLVVAFTEEESASLDLKLQMRT